MNRISLVIVVAASAATALAYSNLVAQSRAAAASSEWPTYGHDAGGQRFSPLTQITPANVDRLQVAWVYHMRPAPAPDSTAPSGGGQGRGGRGGSGFASSETTPIVADGLMYITTPYGRVVALDSTTGKEIWTFSVPAGNASTRGVEYWAGDAQTPAQIVFGTGGGRLFSLDAKTGEPNA